MKERPILFSGEMVRAILDARKTQTRRVIKSHGWDDMDPKDIRVESFHPVVVDKNGDEVEGEEIFGAYDIYGESGAKCPFGKPGDRLWVRETHAMVPRTAYWHDQSIPHVERGDQWVVYRQGWTRCAPTWKPSIHMPRWASRITLEITNVRVERLQDISEGDAKAEGLKPLHPSSGPLYREQFFDLWESIYGKESWNVNPWVWVVEFKRCT